MIVKRKSFSFFSNLFKRDVDKELKQKDETGKIDLIDFFSILKDKKINFPHIDNQIDGISYHNFGGYTMRAVGVDMFGMPKKLNKRQSKVLRDHFNNLKTYMVFFLEDHPGTQLTVDDIELFAVFLDKDKTGDLKVYFAFQVIKEKGDSKKGYVFEYSASLNQ